MELHAVDWAIIVGYFAITLFVGLLFTKRATHSMTDFFVSGRSFAWWLAGTSMVATTFASDTPLAVSGLIAKNGLAGNWFWWALAVGSMVTVFLYARLWRRSEVLTDLQLTEMRYGGRPASFLRCFRALYFVFILQMIPVSWVTGAMLKVLNQTVFYAWHPLGDGTLIAILLGMTGIYSVLSGMWGVALTDFFQFWLAMAGCIVLAFMAVAHVGGVEALQAKMAATHAGGAEIFQFFPSFSGQNIVMPLNIFLIMIFFQWWASSYEDPAGSGYIVQRMASCKDERQSLLATLWFRIAHYCIRPWPWIMVGYAALVMFPEIRDWALHPEQYRPDQLPDLGYPMVIRALAPVGIRGLLLVTFLAAFMSTISTMTNLSASYLINDFYKRFVHKTGTDKHFARAGQVGSGVVLILGGIVTYLMKDVSITTAWKIMAAVGAGAGTVSMLRWFWWRISAWSEIAAMAGSLVYYVAVQLVIVILGWFDAGSGSLAGTLKFLKTEEYQMLIVAGLTIATWLIVTFLTPPEKSGVLESFYRKIRPGGPGWKPIAKIAPGVRTDKNIGLSIVAVIISSAIIYLALPGVGAVIFGQYLKALALLGGAGVCAALLYLLMKHMGWKEIAGRDDAAAAAPVQKPSDRL